MFLKETITFNDDGGNVMELYFKPIDFSNLAHCEVLSKWYNNPSINFLISPNFKDSPLPHRPPTYFLVNSDEEHEIRYTFFIIVDQEYIGDVGIIDNPEYLLKKGYDSAWLSITIGDYNLQGKGIGCLSMDYIEVLAKKLGFRRIELGVFDFNERAISFYKKLGYHQFGVNKKFTYYNGFWHDDLRFEKFI